MYVQRKNKDIFLNMLVNEEIWIFKNLFIFFKIYLFEFIYFWIYLFC